MFQKLFIIILMSLTLIASNEEDLFNSVDQTYSDDMYADIYLSTISIDNFENNATQRKVKEDFEKILPEYLDATNLFSKESFKDVEKYDSTNYIWRDFFSASLIYMQYLEHAGKIEDVQLIMKRNLINLNALIANSNDMTNYSIALGLYKKVYSHEIASSKSVSSLIRQYPPPDKSLYFEKLELEKNDALNDIDEEKSEDNVTEDQKKMLEHVKSSAKNYINMYYEKMETALRSESPEQIENYKQYRKKERDEDFSTWNTIKLMFFTIIAKVLQPYLGYNIFFDYMAEFIGKTIAIIHAPSISDRYMDHIKLIQQYDALIKR